MTTSATPAEDFYGLLGIDPSADAEHVRRAWRDLVWQHHPDRAGARAAPMYQKMSEAYAVLSDPAARALTIAGVRVMWMELALAVHRRSRCARHRRFGCRG